jgi:hypothetical protein
VVLHARTRERAAALGGLAPDAAGVVIGDLSSAAETREPSGAPLLGAKPQLRGRMKAPAPRLELGTCRLTGGLPSAREQRPCGAGQPRHLHKGW